MGKTIFFVDGDIITLFFLHISCSRLVLIIINPVVPTFLKKVSVATMLERKIKTDMKKARGVPF